MSSGVVMVFTAPDGRVIAHAADFDRSAPGGFSQTEAQTYRCKRALDAAVFYAFASPALVEAVDVYDREKAVRQLEHKGYRSHTITVEVPT